MMSRILILYTSIGSGHLQAARSIQAALTEMDGNHQIRLSDLFGKTPRGLGLLDLLSGLVNLALPGLYTWSWQTGGLMAVFQLSRRLPWYVARVRREIAAFQPDVIACTHALPCAIAANLPGVRGRIPLVAVATDFDIHPYWPARQVDAFVTAGTAGRDILLERGMDPLRIHPLGIPIRPEIPRLSRPVYKKEGFTVLVMAGGGQTGSYLPIRPAVFGVLRRLAEENGPDVTWKFIFGADAASLRRARQIAGSHSGIELYGYLDDLPAHMSNANLLLTKPGGLTLAEACAIGVPILLLSRGAGQEAANARVLLSAGAARLADSPAEIISAVNILQADPARLRSLSQKGAALGRPDAARQTARLICSLLAREGL